MGGLNREIQDILAYKEYNSVNRLFHLACKAKREVQGRRASMRANIPVGRASLWTPSNELYRQHVLPHNLPRPSSHAALQQILYHAQVNQLEEQRLHLPRVHPRWYPRGEQGMFSAYATKDMAMYARTTQAHV